MKKLTRKKLFIKLLYFTLFAYILIFIRLGDTFAQTPQSLCEQRDLFPLLAFSTEEYHIAICKGFESDAYFYASQSRDDASVGIFLPISEKNNPHNGANPWLLKAHNDQYTYQVAEFNPLQKNSYVSISVFNNGERIYHRITDSYLPSTE